jgi:tellurite resistance protein TerB
MGFWDNLKDKVSSMNDGLKTQVTRYKNADFANASMAMCAMIAAADGSIDPAEKQKTAAFITNNEVLSVFSAADLKEKFDYFCRKLESDYDFGKIETIQAIGKLKKYPDQARAVIQVGIIIGGADGNFDLKEKAAVKAVCHAVGVPPSEFDL